MGVWGFRWATTNHWTLVCRRALPPPDVLDLTKFALHPSVPETEAFFFPFALAFQSAFASGRRRQTADSRQQTTAIVVVAVAVVVRF